MRQKNILGENAIPIKLPSKKDYFKVAIIAKINKWHNARANAHKLGLYRIARHKRSGINYEIIKKIIKPKHNEKTIEFLEKTFESGCVIILNNDDFLNLNTDDEVDLFIKNHLGSDEKLSSIVFINNDNALTMMQPIIDKNNWIELKKIKKSNSGNEHWKGQYAIDIRGGKQDSIEKGIIQLFNMDYDYASEKTKIAIEAQMTLMLLKSIDSKKLFINPNELKLIEHAYKEYCKENSLYDKKKLISLNIISEELNLICPICGRNIHSNDLLGKGEKNNNVQLLHLKPLTSGEFNHTPYNLGLGCSMCNAFQGGFSISDTIKRAREIVKFHEK